jgi:hypothetical protein
VIQATAQQSMMVMKDRGNWPIDDDAGGEKKREIF